MCTWFLGKVFFFHSVGTHQEMPAGVEILALSVSLRPFPPQSLFSKSGFESCLLDRLFRRLMIVPYVLRKRYFLKNTKIWDIPVKSPPLRDAVENSHVPCFWTSSRLKHSYALFAKSCHTVLKRQQTYPSTLTEGHFMGSSRHKTTMAGTFQRFLLVCY